MHLDFEDHRPDTPRVPSVISRREGILLSLIAHLLFVIAVILAPRTGLFDQPPAKHLLLRPDQRIQFVAIEPLVDRMAPPKRPAVQSDMDRRSMTPVLLPKPENADPVSRGNSQEKMQGAPDEKPVGPESPTPAPPAPNNSNTPPPPHVTTKVIPDVSAASRPAGGSLGDSLRNLQRYLQDQNFDNAKGSATDQGADIQFDSKGIDFGPWLRRFRAQVYRNWLVPQTAQLLSGHVVLQLNIHRDGSITELRIVQASSIASFNNAAFNALKISNPTMALPAEYPADVVLFTVTFFYNERIR